MKSLECNGVEAVRNTIKHWVESKDYPKEFQEFFSKWVLLNLYYNEISKQNHEVCKVLDFGKRHESLFIHVKDGAFELATTECVGEGFGAAPPNRWVKTATLQLRKKLNVDTNRVCATCRSEKRQKCREVKTVEYEFGCMEALMRILYQIRCNLFHGDKTEREEFQMERNKFLVRIGDRILTVILNILIGN